MNPFRGLGFAEITLLCIALVALLTWIVGMN